MSHLPGGPPPPPGGRDRFGPGAGDPAWPPGPRQDGADAREAFRVPFSVVDGFVAVLWLILAQLVVALPAVVIGAIDPEEGGPGLLMVVIVSQAVGLAGALTWLVLRQRLSWRLLGPARPRPRHVLIGVGIGVVGFVGVNIVILSLLPLVGPVDPPEQQLLEEVTVGGLTTVLAVFAAVVMAPVLEEVVFRGMLFQALKRRAGLWPAAILSGLLFAAVHVEITQPLFSLGLLGLGVVFALGLHRTGSLIVPIVGHAAFNLVVVVIILTGGEFIDVM